MTDMTETLPRWSVADVHESFESRSFVDALEQTDADSTRLTALFDEHDIRRCETRAVTQGRWRSSRRVLRAVNDNARRVDIVGAYVYATVSTDSFDENAQGLLSELEVIDAQTTTAARPACRLGQFAGRRRTRPQSAVRSPNTSGH